MARFNIHITDRPIVLGDGAEFHGHEVVTGGSTYGRILFKEFPNILVIGRNVNISNCVLWNTSGWGMGISCE